MAESAILPTGMFKDLNSSSRHAVQYKCASMEPFCQLYYLFIRLTSDSQITPYVEN